MLAEITEYYTEKKGFHREPKDIINTLKTLEVTQFQNMLDALQQSFDLDKTLKNNGPFTVFASPDTAFKKLSDEDFQGLFGNKKNLRQVMEYHIVKGKFTAEVLKNMKSLKTMEGHEVELSTRNGDIYVDKSKITMADVPCTNGIIHVLNKLVMPPLSH